MSLKKEFKWKSRSHSVKGFIHNYQKHLPMIVKVEQGFCGIDDDDEYAYSADEVYRLEKLIIQNKLIFKNGQDQLFAVPENYSCRFQILYDRGKRSSPLPLIQLQDKLDVGMKVEIEENMKTTFKLPVLGESQMVSANLGILQYEDYYEEQVLIGRPLIDASPQPDQVRIPSFVDIQLVLADGLEGGTEFDYAKVCADIARVCKSFKSTVGNNKEDIMMVTCDIDELTEEYKNITPVHYVRCDQVRRDVQRTETEISQTMVQSQAYTTVQPPRAGAGPKQESTFPPPALPDALYKGGTKDEEEYDLPQTMLSRDPAAPPPLPPKHHHQSKDRRGLRLPAPPPGSDTGISKQRSPSPRLPSLRKPTVDGPSQMAASLDKKPQLKHDYVNKVNPVSPMPHRDNDIYSSIDETSELLEDYVDMAALSRPPPVLKTPGSTPTTDSQLHRSVSSASSTYSEENPYASFAEVPQRVSGMTVEEVASCLRLMRLDSHVERFLEENIDGSMLLDMDKDMLANEFNFTAFECKKLMKFVSGWRPKQQAE